MVTTSHLQGGGGCGNLNEECCYDKDDAYLCRAGQCAPQEDVDESDIEKLPCVCAETVCVRNSQWVCPKDQAVCPQSKVDLPACGAEGQICCNGSGCDEVIDLSGGEDEVSVELLCNEEFYDKETGQSTRCEMPADVVDQTFDGCGNAFEKCCSGDRCDDDEFECRCAIPTYMQPATNIMLCYSIAVAWSALAHDSAGEFKSMLLCSWSMPAPCQVLLGR